MFNQYYLKIFDHYLCTIININLFIIIIIHSYIQYTHPLPSLTDVCPSSTRSQAPLPRLQTRIVLSSDPEARRPSDSTAREVTYYNIEQGRELIIIIIIIIIVLIIIIISIVIIIVLIIIITCNLK